MIANDEEAYAFPAYDELGVCRASLVCPAL